MTLRGRVIHDGIRYTKGNIGTQNISCPQHRTLIQGKNKRLSQTKLFTSLSPAFQFQTQHKLLTKLHFGLRFSEHIFLQLPELHFANSNTPPLNPLEKSLISSVSSSMVNELEQRRLTGR